MDSSNNNNNTSSCLMGFGENLNSDGLCPMMIMPNSSSHNNNTLFHNNTSHNLNPFFMENNQNFNIDHGGSSSSSSSSLSLKSKIMAHPHYNRLLAAYVNCQKVGAPPEVVARLEEAYRVMVGQAGSGCVGEDPSLDQFMEAYCEMLSKYEEELSKPFKEAMLFLSRIESQFKALTLPSSDSGFDGNGSSEEEAEFNNGVVNPLAEDRDLKDKLLKKYSGYLGSLKQEFMKKRKKGKLPKEARNQLLEWWSRNFKWPYPSESQKLALAESTGLDQKQINNWFINQRKRHWKPSEDMQFVMMEPNSHPYATSSAAHYYMDNASANPFPMDISPSLH